MLFSEIYSAYYNAVAAIIASAVEHTLTEADIRELTAKHAFAESLLTVEPSLKNEKWPLIRKDLSTPIQHPPTMPLTHLQCRWMKAISLDPRVKLFGFAFDGLEDVQPLFTPEDVCVFDRYSDGDDYGNEDYIARFRLILSAVRASAPLEIEMCSGHGSCMTVKVMPLRLEYSEKDDKFRLITTGCRSCSIINLARITSCRLYRGSWRAAVPDTKSGKEHVTLELVDERNALERVMLHFAHFEKQAEQLDERHYRITISYDVSDRTELVIRVLSFGPMIKVTEPQSFVELIKERLRRQTALMQNS